MAYNWLLALKPTPQIHALNHILGAHLPCHPTSTHTYITTTHLTSTHDIPGIPFPYATEHFENRALYVRGVPKSWSNNVLEAMFRAWGNPQIMVVLISLSAEETFRWVVMESEGEAERALDEAHGRSLGGDGGYFYVSRSLSPGMTLTVVRRELLEHQPEFGGELMRGEKGKEKHKAEAEKLTHGHPEPERGGGGHGYTASVATIMTDISNNPRLFVEDVDTPEKGATEIFSPSKQQHGQFGAPANQGSIQGFYPSDIASHELYQGYQPPVWAANQAPYQGYQAPIRPYQRERLAEANAIAQEQQAKEEEIVEEEVEQEDEPDQEPAPPAPFVTQTSTWAKITGTANVTKPGNITIKPDPNSIYTYKSTSALPRLRSIGRIPPVIHSSDNDAARVVFLLNLPCAITPDDVTNAVHEGPLVKMQFGTDADSKKPYCGVIFHYARDAAAFERVLSDEKRCGRPERFCFLVDHARTEQIVGLEETLEAMGNGATRRLTIVKTAFFYTVKEKELMDTVYDLVGKETLQCFHMYNGGNATMVFTDVSAAIRVKKCFDDKAKRAGEGGIWSNVITTYSKDPCVAPLEFKTSIHDFHQGYYSGKTALGRYME